MDNPSGSSPRREPPMPIPDFDDHVLPEGLHDCTIDEVEAVFGRFQRSDKRVRLTEKLRQYLAAARRSGIIQAVIVDGSYVTAVDEPGDIDIIVVLPADWDLARELKPFEYNVVTKVGVRRMGYPFDVLVELAGTVGLKKSIDFFAQVNTAKYPDLTSRERKGLLRIVP